MRLSILLVLGALVLSGTAAAKPPTTIAPPGDSAVSQYVEDVPTDRGATPSPPSAGSQGGALTTGQARRLDGLGSQGRVLASVVNATAPAAAAGSSRARGAGDSSAAGSGGAAAAGVGFGRGGSSGGAGTGSASALPLAGGRSPASLLVHAFVGGGAGGLGIILPAMMLAAAFGAVAWSVRRRRTAS